MPESHKFQLCSEQMMYPQCVGACVCARACTHTHTPVCLNVNVHSSHTDSCTYVHVVNCIYHIKCIVHCLSFVISKKEWVILHSVHQPPPSRNPYNKRSMTSADHTQLSVSSIHCKGGTHTAALQDYLIRIINIWLVVVHRVHLAHNVTFTCMTGGS